jgi:hypothetical protein
MKISKPVLGKTKIVVSGKCDTCTYVCLPTKCVRFGSMILVSYLGSYTYEVAFVD